MNLDPIDIFGETIGAPIKRGFTYFNASYRKAKWANELSELRAYNSLRNAMREEMASKGELDDSGEL